MMTVSFKFIKEHQDGIQTLKLHFGGAEVGKLRRGGHVWPGEPFHRAQIQISDPNGAEISI